MEIESVIDARWRFRSLILRDQYRKIRLDFGFLDRAEKLWLIEFFRRAVPASVQRDWEACCHHVALPLRRSLDSQPRPPQPDEVFVTRLDRDKFFLSATALALEIGATLVWVFGQKEFWLFPAAVVAMWIALRSNVPRQGEYQQKLSFDREMVGALWFVAMLTAAALLGLFVFSRFWQQIPQARTVAIVTQVAWFAILAFGLIRMNRSSQAALMRARQVSVEQWENESGGAA